MEPIKLLNLENDGLNMVIDGQYLYIRCKRAMYKYNLTDMSLTAHNVIFKKDGKARAFSISNKYIFLTDFCDLYILAKDDLQIVEVMRLGTDLSSDLGVVRFDSQKAYIGIRNGEIAVMNIDKRASKRFKLSDSSFWDFYIVDDRIYAGSVQGELIEIDTNDMRVIRNMELCKKNIYSVVLSDGLIYTVSQDMTIKAVYVDSFEIACVAKKAVKGMAKILGIHKNFLVVSDSNKITFWDKDTLQFRKKFDFPTGSFNKGIILDGNRLYGSDYQSVYSVDLAY